MIPWWWLIPAVIITGLIVTAFLSLLAVNRCNDCLLEREEIEKKRVKELRRILDGERVH